MTLLTSHIAQLLQQRHRVTIPGVGTFIAAYKPASINHVQGEILPPTSALHFDAEQQADDGVLLQYLQAQTGAMASELQQELAHFADSIQAALARKESVELPSIGTISKNYRQEIQFQPNEAYNYNTEAYGLPTLRITPLHKQPEYPLPAATAHTDTPYDPVYTAEYASATATAPNPSVWVRTAALRARLLRTLIATPTLVTIGVLSLAVILYSWLRSTTPPTPLATHDEGITRLNQRPEMSPAAIFTPTTEPEEEVALIPAAEDAEDTEELAEVLSATPNAPASAQAPATTECLIIVGQFQDRANAKRVVQQIAKLGYTPYQRQSGNLTRVGATFDCGTHDPAATLRLLQRKFDARAWLVK